MDLQLAGKRALITGSSSGIGSEIARMLAAEGIGVVVHGRNAERTQAVVRQIEDAGGRAAARWLKRRLRSASARKRCARRLCRSRER